ncbi:MAG: type II toxin-antitoxin system mRNA interferase toxin, RelE/StbE family [Candidatus Uhrbacteria bacterium]|nr:type II toxin-antitoxin system mRNA interferase toxin, RelE/StbE family [Candidatus Uhrbacteria bacterium]
MRVVLHKKFDKKLKKYPLLNDQARERIILFVADPFHPTLNNHSLIGTWIGYRSININGDYRAVYRLTEESIAYFVDLDTHSNLYR